MFLRSFSLWKISTSKVFTPSSLILRRSISIPATNIPDTRDQIISNDEAPTTNIPDLTPLKLTNELYATVKVHERPYVVTKGDRLILPFKVKQAAVGDILTLNNVTAIGSRNYKLVGHPIDPSLYTIRATVLEKTKRAFQVREVTKRRNRRVRHATTKGDLTILRISELTLN
ncbi:mitochondrial 54S ribosomal protein bL21m NDAI_0G05460 [Naumovozyma dairenensis CBS 421]|uniref:Large ribosomal subunit protein bL21m n=1 Tax=Naumovozyma dairenensis (strain ATCC 10597 / BCRC 20456 / CBS 421 / NBRC 0211 / NRRL Y-12639) TaxID=1071378 RepID=J7REJ0_NAUDC|nr:hypothetical protein NDAI_0G05460 [Naumovozyma dairenensis CBS 421]CCK73529.1 hypothetical protein NDAI_0G05460 [Naumovozyma dairenensis CBS 421]